MKQLEVALGDRSYPIFIDASLLQCVDKWKDFLNLSEVFIISNETVSALYLSDLVNSLGIKDYNKYILPDGEQYKNIEHWYAIQEALIKANATRSVSIIALGGGVVGDIAGFVAASYQRGSNLIQIPTTLLAQVDSSVGGKTAINHPLAKNMIGAFYQPQAVVIDTKLLNSLPDREYNSGLAEVLKYGLIFDKDFYQWLLDNLPKLSKRDPDALEFAISRSCTIKAEVVAADEHDLAMRAILNFGHTFAHAIEAVTNYKKYLHGEAVTIGMLAGIKLSTLLGFLDKDTYLAVENWLSFLGLPTKISKDIEIEEVILAMQQDKKRMDKNLRFVILTAIGTAEVRTIESNDMIRSAFTVD